MLQQKDWDSADVLQQKDWVSADVLHQKHRDSADVLHQKHWDSADVLHQKHWVCAILVLFMQLNACILYVFCMYITRILLYNHKLTLHICKQLKFLPTYVFSCMP